MIRFLDTSVINLYRRDPEVMAKWHTASHIQRAPRSAAAPAVDPAPVPNGA